ncbi:MAG: hypothetical protein JWP92_108 [Caulobacter sp.]|nr:hypothetical protein [Caulobacter sp.]
MARTEARGRFSPLFVWLIMAVITVGLVLGWLGLRDGLRLPRGVDVALRLPGPPHFTPPPTPEPLPLPGPPRV